MDSNSAIDLTHEVTTNGSLVFKPPEPNSSWRIFTFWEKYTNQRSCTGVKDADNIIANGSWTVDHFSTIGAKITTDFFDQYVNDDSEVADLLSQVGNYGMSSHGPVVTLL